MNIDDQIEAKQLEIQENHDWISNSEFLGEVSPGQPIKINTAKDLIEYTIHTRTETLLEIEYEILLDTKHPSNARGDHAELIARAHDLRNEISDLTLKLGE